MASDAMKQQLRRAMEAAFEAASAAAVDHGVRLAVFVAVVVDPASGKLWAGTRSFEGVVWREADRIVLSASTIGNQLDVALAHALAPLIAVSKAEAIGEPPAGPPEKEGGPN